MNQALFAIRYFIVLIAIMGSLYMSHIDSYANYTFFSLFYIAMNRLHDRFKGTRFEPLVKVIQLSIIWYLVSVYRGLLYILIYAVLFAVHPSRNNKTDAVFMFIQGIMINAAIYQEPASTIILSNLMYLIIVASLFLLGKLSNQKEEIQFLYDSLRKNHYELIEARKRLVEYAQKVENSAQMEERNRISKEIHDEIGHQLIRIKLMMEAGLRILPGQQDKGMQILYQIRDHLEESMETLRTTVRKLNPTDHLRKGFSLRQLIEGFSKDSGIRVQFTIKGEPSFLYPSVEVAMYRNAQEALTNAVRHGGATQIAVEVDYGSDQIEMAISNNGRIPTKIDKGLGIRGMEERVELLGGFIETEITDRFVIRTMIPYKRHFR